MNKALFLFFLSTLFFFSCDKKNDIKLRRATGKINTISVIIDDQLWNGEVGDSIRNKFASAVIGLTEEEPLFTINQPKNPCRPPNKKMTIRLLVTFLSNFFFTKK